MIPKTFTSDGNVLPVFYYSIENDTFHILSHVFATNFYAFMESVLS